MVRSSRGRGRTHARACADKILPSPRARRISRPPATSVGSKNGVPPALNTVTCTRRADWLATLFRNEKLTEILRFESHELDGVVLQTLQS